MYSEVWVAILLGLVSSVLDNMPLVAATMSKNDLTAYAGRSGGSVLSIGSASGIMLMRLEKVRFLLICKKSVCLR